MATTHEIEKRALAPARWANLFMGCAGITAAILSNASALMLDGLFSGINFVAAIFAAKVAASVARRPDKMRPFGYEVDESLYVMFRSLVLTGVIIFAALSAASKIFWYISGEEVPEVKLNWVVIYMVLMVVVCFSLAAWYHQHWIKCERQSDLLKTERSAAIIDGNLSLASGMAFLLIALLKGTPLAFLVPISDSLVVLGLTAYMISSPIKTFSIALREVAGESADPEILGAVRRCFVSLLAEKPFQLNDLSVLKTGRAFLVVAYIRPEKATRVEELDAIRAAALKACETELPGSVMRVEIVYTAWQAHD